MPKKYKFISWNVNGLRAVAKKGFKDWIENCGADIVCLQETKAQPDQVPEDLVEPKGFVQSAFNSAERKGYSGVANYFSKRLQPQEINHGFGIDRYDVEGRVIESHHKIDDLEFVLFNVYFPNGGASDERLSYKLDFYDDFLKHLQKLKKQGKHLVITGDYNTAHHAIDLARPKENEKTSGFMPVEREWLDKLEAAGFVDTFRHFNKEPDNFTWWSFRTAARKRNVGWRIDYFFVSDSLLPYLKDADILSDVMGSDHCPVSLELSY